ncbi:MAG TPA: hypothetical protein VGK32_12325 [Vicinamibacterales bacterium]|jgi:hypothetical protein
MKKNEGLITASSIRPEPDPGCASLCYYAGWDFEHSHTKEAEAT